MKTGQKTQLANDKDSSEFARVYYQHQYERLSKLEDQRLTITNFVMTLSAGGLALGFSRLDSLTVINGIGIPLMIMFSNLFAIAYILRTRDFIEVHKERARCILERYAEDLAVLNKSIVWPEKRSHRHRTFLQISLHVLLMLTSLLPVFTYLRRFL